MGVGWQKEGRGRKRECKKEERRKGKGGKREGSGKRKRNGRREEEKEEEEKTDIKEHAHLTIYTGEGKAALPLSSQLLFHSCRWHEQLSAPAADTGQSPFWTL